MPVAHVVNLVRALRYAAEAKAPVSILNYHFGAEGSGGCGMYGVLSGANAKIRETLNRPEDIFYMLNLVRDRYGRILSTDCRITGSVLYGSKDSMTYDLDEIADREALMAEKELVL